MLASLLLVVSFVVNLCVGLFVIIKNPRSGLHRTLTALVVSMSVWISVIYLSDQVTSYVLFWNRAVFVGPLCMAYFAYLFLEFLAGLRRFELRHWLVGLGTAVAVAVSLSDCTITSVTARFADGAIAGYDLDRGYGYLVVVVWLIMVAFVGVYSAYRAFIKARGVYRAQLRFVFAGFSACVLLSITTNILLPLGMHTTEYAKYAPLSTIALSLGLSYAILRHRFLDIRAVVARSVAYVVLVSLLATLYAAGIYVFSLLVLHRAPVASAQDILNLAIVVVLTLAFTALRRLFEKATDRVFFRDSYDTQRVLSALSHAITKEIILDKIQDDVLKIICQNLRVASGLFVVTTSETGIYASRTYGKGMTYIPSAADLGQLGAEVMVLDELPGGHSMRRDMMSRLGCRVALPLRAKGETVGYVLLGDKMSGDVYSSQDISLLELIEGELAVSVQNARSYREISEFNDTLQKRIVEATGQLRRTNKRLRELDATKDEFMSMASHQLRTPLTSIKGYLSMVLDGDAGPIGEEQRRFLEEAYSSSQRMVYLIGDFLNVSRLQTGRFELELNPVSLPTLIVGEISQLKATADARGVKLLFDAPENFPVVSLDENKIRQVMMNLIDNAIYYSKPGGGGTVKIEVMAHAQHVSFQVVDDGIGVPKIEQHNLFTKFYRAHNAKAQRPDGTGIGLFMAKKVVVAHGGSIIFETIEGKGSTFGFRLPLVPATT